MNLESFQRVYDKYFKLARKIGMDVLNDYYLAGDVAQEVFTMMFLKRNELSEEKVKFWIVLNTNRRAKDVVRKSYYRHEVSMNDRGIKMCVGQNQGTAQPEEMAIRNESSCFQLTALDKLREYNEEWYDILICYHLEGETYPSLARRYGKSTENIRMEASRARKWLDRKVIEMYES